MAYTHPSFYKESRKIEGGVRVEKKDEKKTEPPKPPPSALESTISKYTSPENLVLNLIAKAIILVIIIVSVTIALKRLSGVESLLSIHWYRLLLLSIAEIFLISWIEKKTDYAPIKKIAKTIAYIAIIITLFFGAWSHFHPGKQLDVKNISIMLVDQAKSKKTTKQNVVYGCPGDTMEFDLTGDKTESPWIVPRANNVLFHRDNRYSGTYWIVTQSNQKMPMSGFNKQITEPFKLVREGETRAKLVFS